MKAMVLLVAALLSGCVATHGFLPAGGSKADGTVILSAQGNALHPAPLPDAAALATATASCKAWGYAGAELFSASGENGGRGVCPPGVNRTQCPWKVTVVYQCTQ
jgi:hypothetical protein